MITEAKEPFWIDCDAGSDDALGKTHMECCKVRSQLY